MHFDLSMLRGYVDPHVLAQASAFLQVVLIDIVMAGDNALAVGIAASHLPADKRRTAILFGLIGAVIVRIGFVLVTVRLFEVVGLLLAGGLLLLWVAQKMWVDLRHRDAKARARHDLATATGTVQDDPRPAAKKIREASLFSAVVQILIADLSMSLDNVLAVTGAARHHVWVLVFGLLFSIAAMGLAASVIARVLHKVRWIGYIGVLIIVVVSARMIYEGATQVWIMEHCDATLKCVPETWGYTVEWWKHGPDHFHRFADHLQKRFSR